MKFAVSYSCGKDGTLALHRMIKEGHTPVALIVTVNRELNRSWFHGVDIPLLNCISDSLGLPMLRCVTDGEGYHTALEEGLFRAKELGAEACVFGDIDIEGHLEWNRERCRNAGLECIMPLWRQDREKIVCELIDSGFIAVVKCIQNAYLKPDILGKTLTKELLKEIKKTGADVCGENGEYHTLVTDGPLFKFPVRIELKEILNFGTHSAVNIVLKENESI